MAATRVVYFQYVTSYPVPFTAVTRVQIPVEELEKPQRFFTPVLSRLTIRNGGGNGGGLVHYGGGIFNQGTLRVIDSTLSGNVAVTTCDEICPAEGSGIYNTGRVTIRNSTLSGNTARVE